MKKPEIVVFAGPNGSGKSTFTEYLRPRGVKYINADDIFKKRKTQYWYCPQKFLWRKSSIIALTGIQTVQRAPLNLP